ncbi:hypothetical protein DFR72_105276 [Lentzea flaviverrucosa]|uniref:Uncharacterized protein n=1 Tax=Lentzea flaviverrucosa TaxID=200379 RepID=A0A1H9PI19_9PSEU|nr:hypothetical protein DFR72_105276 [Lentzea flaviverrucosa]SER47213.1 hypothetical protein SAMN05216195_105296 [Lentzea flaviverrucosa]
MVTCRVVVVEDTGSAAMRPGGWSPLRAAIGRVVALRAATLRAATLRAATLRAVTLPAATGRVVALRAATLRLRASPGALPQTPAI